MSHMIFLMGKLFNILATGVNQVKQIQALPQTSAVGSIHIKMLSLITKFIYIFIFFLANSQIAIDMIEDIASALANVANVADEKIKNSVIGNWSYKQVSPSGQEFSNIFSVLFSVLN